MLPHSVGNQGAFYQVRPHQGYLCKYDEAARLFVSAGIEIIRGSPVSTSIPQEIGWQVARRL
jgi:hypothetical protein